MSCWHPVLPREEDDVHTDDFSFLALGSTWDHFYMFTSTILHLCSFFLGLQLCVTAEFTLQGAFSLC